MRRKFGIGSADVILVRQCTIQTYPSFIGNAFTIGGWMELGWDQDQWCPFSSKWWFVFTTFPFLRWLKLRLRLVMKKAGGMKGWLVYIHKEKAGTSYAPLWEDETPFLLLYYGVSRLQMCKLFKSTDCKFFIAYPFPLHRINPLITIQWK